MTDYTQLNIVILAVPLPILTYLWFKYYNIIITEGTKYVGEKYREEEVLLLPSSTRTVKIDGKVSVLVYGVNPWITIRVNSGPKQKIFKIRLLNESGNLELINESKVFQVRVKLRYSV
ncbi:hypothetical protein SULI_00190 [Saccharolobus solfataricus]|uniref:Uncharacterized protein n=3 Tax=Saccharolobus solfataricus TaxID=2287 RepID=Q97WJ6_SACS2|nr:hypothetical protein [Saccharolobus solfataricus]AAK42390.1 Hypothetical protein SSO2221 [Saccharolobus solfataricus P2]AKA72492.1 hypothetical protein SULB_0038 [Saccharolobus solfataricus]AKA75192.1 hypothetical protein SULC_0037 [Saccharolobus solfataricus]AKA77885.1 hypothetical protein SULA_0037 [Saccharolobus solfataricus]AZF67006.1 hypothetical protein SULG_00190 [Saccharolobus solfataricus]